MEKPLKQIILGIDVSKEKLDIINTKTGAHIMIDNHVRSVGKFLSPYRQSLSAIKVVLEPTGGYE